MRTQIKDLEFAFARILAKKRRAMAGGLLQGVVSLLPRFSVFTVIDIIPTVPSYSLNATTVGNATTEAPYIASGGLSEFTSIDTYTLATGASTDSATIRKTIQFSKIKNLANAYFEAFIIGKTGDTIHIDLFNSTGAAEIAGTNLSGAAPNGAVLRVISADIKANLPVVDSLMTVRGYDATTNADAVQCMGARLQLFW